MILNAAQSGAVYHPKEYPSIPVTPAELIADARRCQDAGAGFLHIHARSPITGYQFSSQDWYEAVRGGLFKAAPELLVGFPTSRKGEVGPQISATLDAKAMALNRSLTAEEVVEAELIRAVGAAASPDTLTTFTAPEIKIVGKNAEDEKAALESYSTPDALRWSDSTVMQLYYRKLREIAGRQSIGEELEITTWGAMDVVEKIALTEHLGMAPEVHFVFLFGFSSRLPIDRSVYEMTLNRLQTFRERTGRKVAVTAGAVIPPAKAARTPRKLGEPPPPGEHDYQEILEWVLEDDRVDALRVGLEDTPVLYGVKQTNADLVKMVAGMITTLGGSIETDPFRIRNVFLRDRWQKI